MISLTFMPPVRNVIGLRVLHTSQVNLTGGYKIGIQMNKPNGLFLVALFYQGVGYLLVNKTSKGLMIWDTYMGAAQALVKVEQYLGPLNPEILYVSSEQFPGVSDLHLNDFILEVSGVHSITDIRLKEIPGLGLVYPCLESKLSLYKLHIGC